MVSLVALDLVLRIILAGVVSMPFVVEIPRMHLDDLAADVPGLRVPGDVIADLESSWNESSPLLPIFP
jgi:hypothetical protein